MYRKSQVSFLEGMSSTNQWCVPDEVHDVLAVDFDRSLSGLEVDLCTSSNNMSSAVFAVPEMSRKEDMHNSNHGPIEVYPVTLVNRKKNRYSIMAENDCTNSVKRFCFNGKEMEPYDTFEPRRCRPHSLSAPEIRTTSSHIYSGQVINTILSQVVQLPVMPASQTVDQGNQGPPSAFLCILVAPTSIATKINEETLTYLNQAPDTAEDSHGS
ncbi:hypothetical protein JTE90_015845 [Oedothorax gibbosus]|uniref:Grh/CP2 DB domain-containing protein n=1 Tax=Oedothorax gibbosus TaxID=931172 RepID=A0AAV6VT68_9ARAC|nr:hypothetical protein JTE90_015845 [Oedothorax gibbosus]